MRVMEVLHILCSSGESVIRQPVRLFLRLIVCASALYRLDVPASDSPKTVTRGDPQVDLFTGVSIHAPARGATTAQSGISRAAAFQSTRPHGARRLRAVAAK